MLVDRTDKTTMYAQRSSGASTEGTQIGDGSFNVTTIKGQEYRILPDRSLPISQAFTVSSGAKPGESYAFKRKVGNCAAPAQE